MGTIVKLKCHFNFRAVSSSILKQGGGKQTGKKKVKEQYWATSCVINTDTDRLNDTYRLSHLTSSTRLVWLSGYLAYYSVVPLWLLGIPLPDFLLECLSVCACVIFGVISQFVFKVLGSPHVWTGMSMICGGELILLHVFICLFEMTMMMMMTMKSEYWSSRVWHFLNSFHRLIGLFESDWSLNIKAVISGLGRCSFSYISEVVWCTRAALQNEQAWIQEKKSDQLQINIIEWINAHESSIDYVYFSRILWLTCTAGTTSYLSAALNISCSALCLFLLISGFLLIKLGNKNAMLCENRLL